MEHQRFVTEAHYNLATMLLKFRAQITKFQGYVSKVSKHGVSLARLVMHGPNAFLSVAQRIGVSYRLVYRGSHCSQWISPKNVRYPLSVADSMLLGCKSLKGQGSSGPLVGGSVKSRPLVKLQHTSPVIQSLHAPIYVQEEVTAVAFLELRK